MSIYIYGHIYIYIHIYIIYFTFSYCSWDSQGKNAEVVCHSLLQWTTFCQNSLWIIGAFELSSWKRLLRVSWTARRSNRSILQEISPEYSFERLMLKLNTLATWCEELTHLKRPWCWEGLGAGGEGDDRGWDGWMASLTQWTWAWASSRCWWRTGKPGMLQSMGSQRVGHNWATEQCVCVCVCVPPRGITREKTHKLRWYDQEVALPKIKNICVTSWSFPCLTPHPPSVLPTCTHIVLLLPHAYPELCTILLTGVHPYRRPWFAIKTYSPYAPLPQGCCTHRNDAKGEKEVLWPHYTLHLHSLPPDNAIAPQLGLVKVACLQQTLKK